MTSEPIQAHNWLTEKGGAVHVKVDKSGYTLEKPKNKLKSTSNKLLLPGMVDLNAIVQPISSTTSEAKAAHANGITSLVAMPRRRKNHLLDFYTPATDQEEKHTTVYQTLPLSKDFGDTRTPLDYGSLDKSKVKALIITDKDLLHTKALLRCLQLAKTSGIKVFLQANWSPLCQQAQVHTGQLAVHKGLDSVGASAETIALQLVFDLIRDTGTPLHCTGITSARSVAIIERAKQEGLDITSDVSISHLLFTDQDINDFDTNYKIWPPLRAKEDQHALLQAINTGVIDAISSLHTPTKQTSKHLPFASADYGSATFDAFVPMLVQLLNEKSITPERLVHCCCTQPAKILGIENSDSIIIDPSHTLERGDWHSAGKNSPWYNKHRLGLATVLK